MRSNFSDIQTVLALGPEAISVTTTAAAVDCSKCDEITFWFFVGTDGALDGSNYWTCTLTECATVGGSYTDVADADVDDGTTSPTNSIIINSTSEDDLGWKLGYKGNLQFVKALMTETGTLDGPVCIVAIKTAERMGHLNQYSDAVST